MEKFPFWQEPLERLFERLQTQKTGLSHQEAQKRLEQYGPNTLKAKKLSSLSLFFAQFKSPLIGLLMAAAILSFFLGGRTDASLIFAIVLLSGLLGFFQEKGAIHALTKILQLIAVKNEVIREGKIEEIAVEQVVPGDIVALKGGDIVPADGVIIESNHFFVNESTLTGESAPAEKKQGQVDANTPILKRWNCVFMGTVVSSGTATCLMVQTAKQTEYGQLVLKAESTQKETAFEIGVKKFGYFLMGLTLIMVTAIFIFNLLLSRPWLEMLLFSLALAVGLTPQLLPAIISVNLSHGARKMARKKVIIKRLPSIENFGQMNILCADKTGTVTQGKLELDRITDISGQQNEKCALFAGVNAHFQEAYRKNPLDEAILKKVQVDFNAWQKIGEIPYDFDRKRMSIIFKGPFIITKGAVEYVLDISDRMEQEGNIVPIDRQRLHDYFVEQSSQGLRLIGVAYGETDKEENLIFLGFCSFLDPIKPDIGKVVQELKNKGIQLKILTGDHRAVALHAIEIIEMHEGHLATGEEIHKADDKALEKIVQEKNVFAEVEPNHKERIIQALRRTGHIVGYLGDGVNDISALHASDVSIAVDSGADAAKEISDVVLLEKDLEVLRIGVLEGRKTFANTLKYIHMATSANFGNMFTLAGASLFLPFLPMLPKQVLLTNLLTDLPEMAIATDHVDPVSLKTPQKWDLPSIARFMIVFGLISSLFDFATFGVLLALFDKNESQFQTGWFVESVASAAIIALVVRTKKWSFLSYPSRWLGFAVLGVVLLALCIPFLPYQFLFGFAPLTLKFYGILAVILLLYVLSVEVAKRFFYKHHAKRH